MPRPTPWTSARLRLRSPRLWELVLDAVVVIALVSATGRAESVPLPALALLGLAAASLAARRRAPRLAFVVAAASSAVGGFVWPEAVWVALALWVMAQVCLFSVALRSDRRSSGVAALVLATTLVAQSTLAQGNSVVDLLSVAFVTWTAAVLGAGLAVRAQRDHVAALEERHRAEAADREREVDRRITHERLRIARDLHDSVAHTVAVIALHAGSAEQNLRSDPEGTVASLAAIRTAARTAVGEMQAILRLLRTEADADGAPERTVPGLAAVPDLLRTVRASGLQVSYAEQIEVVDLPPALDVTVYRVLQEALTNAVRYSDGAAEVRVEQVDGAVSVRVTNRPGARPGPPSGTGLGLVGMRERVASVGGRLRVLDTPGSFELVAELEPARTQAAT